MVTLEGLENALRPTPNIHEAFHLSADHEGLDTTMALHVWDVTAVGYKRNVGKCLDIDQDIRCVYIVTISPQDLQYCKVWMLSRTAREMKCFPAPFVAEQLPHLVLSIIVGFALFLTYMCYQNAIPCYLYLEKARIHGGKCSLSMPIFSLE